MAVRRLDEERYVPDTTSPQPDDVPVFHGREELTAAVGREMGPSPWMTMEQSRVNLFADATEDHQWIHIDPEKAAQSPFGSTIAHGFLTLSLVPHFMGMLHTVEGVVMGVNYGLDKVRFPSPVPVGSRMRGRMQIQAADPLPNDGVQLRSLVTLEVEDSDKPACVATMIARYYFQQ